MTPSYPLPLNLSPTPFLSPAHAFWNIKHSLMPPNVPLLPVANNYIAFAIGALDTILKAFYVINSLTFPTAL